MTILCLSLRWQSLAIFASSTNPRGQLTFSYPLLFRQYHILLPGNFNSGFLTHETWPELADYFLAAFDWFGGGRIGKIANTKWTSSNVP